LSSVETTPADEQLLSHVPPHLRDAARLGLTEMHPPFVMDKSKCIECGLCREVCPFTAVFLVPTRWKIAFEIELERCRGCGGPSKAPCVRYCPSPGALVPVPDSLVGA
jgi:Fe-S-cluster-containing hydrogenase component 2